MNFRSEVHGTFTACNANSPGSYSRAGGSMPWTPEQSMILSVNHVQPTNIGDVVIGASYSYKSDIALGDERVEGLLLFRHLKRYQIYMSN